MLKMNKMTTAIVALGAGLLVGANWKRIKPVAVRTYNKVRRQTVASTKKLTTNVKSVFKRPKKAKKAVKKKAKPKKAASKKSKK